MAYKYKVKEAFKDSIAHRGEKSYKLASCSQKDLKKLLELGVKYILEVVEVKSSPAAKPISRTSAGEPLLSKSSL